MTDDNDFEALWHEQFAPLIHEHMPVRATLLELCSKLDGAVGFLKPLSQEVEMERHRGLFVSRLAVNYANKVLETFGMIDETGPYVPTNLQEAQGVLERLRLFAAQQYAQHRSLQEPDDGDDQLDEMIDDLATAKAGADADATDTPTLLLDREASTVEYQGKSVELGSKIQFDILHCLNKKLGDFVHIDTLMDQAWGDDLPTNEALQKQISNLRKSLTVFEVFEIELGRDSYRLNLR